jgi:cytochrome c biogenesis protein CcmG/thiol:disulfide interchange protein DsbE
LPSTPSSADPSAEPPAAPSDEISRPSRRAVIALVVVSLALPLALLAVILVANRDDEPGGATVTPAPGRASASVEVGEPLPDFTVRGLDGDPVQLSAFRGRPVVLTFFASWCHPCEQEMPLLEQAHTDDPDAFAVVAVSYEDLERDSRAFVERLGVTYPVGLDPDGVVKDAYGITGIPQTFFVDAGGVLRDRVYGITSARALDEPLDALLAAR